MSEFLLVMMSIMFLCILHRLVILYCGQSRLLIFQVPLGHFCIMVPDVKHLIEIHVRALRMNLVFHKDSITHKSLPPLPE